MVWLFLVSLGLAHAMWSIHQSSMNLSVVYNECVDDLILHHKNKCTISELDGTDALLRCPILIVLFLDYS